MSPPPTWGAPSSPACLHAPVPGSSPCCSTWWTECRGTCTCSHASNGPGPLAAGEWHTCTALLVSMAVTWAGLLPSVSSLGPTTQGRAPHSTWWSRLECLGYADRHLLCMCLCPLVFLCVLCVHACACSCIACANVSVCLSVSMCLSVLACPVPP